MDESEYLRLRRKIEDEFSQNVDALDRVWRLANQSTEPPIIAVDPSEGPRRTRSGRGEIMNAIRAELKSISSPFTWKAMRDRLSESRPELPANRTTISQALRKLAELKEVDELQPGRGKRPAYYGFSEPQQQAPEGEPTDALATNAQIDLLKDLCKKSGLSVAEFKARYMLPVGYEKAANMPRNVITSLIAEVWGQISREQPAVGA